LKRHHLLRGLHDVLRPRTYFEIGVRNGLSLELSRSRTVAVDPFYNLTREVCCDVHLVRATSDEFFARKHPFAHLDVPRLDLAFIDGMHLSEFALRDLINTERYCHPGSVVVLDDMLPRSVVEAGRGRVGSAAHGAWAGDVYKLVDTLRRLRPDLVVLEVDTQPTGTLVILALDPDSRVLAGAYDELVVEYVTPDPQTVPDATLDRRHAISGEGLLGSGIWSDVVAARDLPKESAVDRVRSACRRSGLLDLAVAS
jgi:hypothetical protein